MQLTEEQSSLPAHLKAVNFELKNSSNGEALHFAVGRSGGPVTPSEPHCLQPKVQQAQAKAGQPQAAGDCGQAKAKTGQLQAGACGGQTSPQQPHCYTQAIADRLRLRWLAVRRRRHVLRRDQRRRERRLVYSSCLALYASPSIFLCHRCVSVCTVFCVPCRRRVRLPDCCREEAVRLDDRRREHATVQGWRGLRRLLRGEMQDQRRVLRPARDHRNHRPVPWRSVPRRG